MASRPLEAVGGGGGVRDEGFAFEWAGKGDGDSLLR